MPFAGLGFAVDDVLKTARALSLFPHCHGGSSGIPLPPQEHRAQPNGYQLLVALGREIRGR